MMSHAIHLNPTWQWQPIHTLDESRTERKSTSGGGRSRSCSCSPIGSMPLTTDSPWVGNRRGLSPKPEMLLSELAEVFKLCSWPNPGRRSELLLRADAPSLFSSAAKLVLLPLWLLTLILLWLWLLKPMRLPKALLLLRCPL